VLLMTCTGGVGVGKVRVVRWVDVPASANDVHPPDGQTNGDPIGETDGLGLGEATGGGGLMAPFPPPPPPPPHAAIALMAASMSAATAKPRNLMRCARRYLTVND